MGVRRALLIGVPTYRNLNGANLPVVNRDISDMQGALEPSGYEVQTLGLEADASRSAILRALREACVNAPRGGTLLLYFSGHGVHHLGNTYLMPADAYLDDEEQLDQYLVPVDIGRFVDRSPAQTVVFFVDACREGIEWSQHRGKKATLFRGWTEAELRSASTRRHVVVFSCGKGELSQFVSGPDGFSLFSRALAHALTPSHPARTLREILTAAQEKLDELQQLHHKRPQRIHYPVEHAVGDEDALAVVICDGVAPVQPTDPAENPWTRRVRSSDLWAACAAVSAPPLQEVMVALREAVATLTACCWVRAERARSHASGDPWADVEYPGRVIDCLELLVLRSSPPVAVSPIEVALLLAAPFIRESVLAAGMASLAPAQPLALGEQSLLSDADKDWPARRWRDRLRTVHESHPQLVQKALRLRRLGAQTDHDAIAFWLAHRALGRTPEIWLREHGELPPDLFAALSTRRDGDDTLLADGFAASRLIDLARCVRADPASVHRRLGDAGRRGAITVGSYGREQWLYELKLGYLLCVAGWMALDVRSAPDLLIDHLGLADPVTPPSVCAALRAARWQPVGAGRAIAITCDHPAIDLAMRELAARANEALDWIHQRIADEGGQLVKDFSGLPVRLTADRVVPAQIDGRPAYRTPHLRFHLAQEEVRELLMGEQLYGDPTLAIRELYQNALDACRYREARIAFLQRNGRTSRPWSGKIVFRQGIDARGRHYIECQDNGVGMGERELAECFAKAGRRFQDLPEFLEERSEWLRCDPPVQLYPNSQFGIGVLSYFMLADDLEVETCRMDRHGRTGERLLVRISGSWSIFRVQPIASEAEPEPGTRVRLYLNRTEHMGQPISCVETLRQMLWVAEYATEATDDRRTDVWEPGRLQPPWAIWEPGKQQPSRTHSKLIVPTRDPDFWWIYGKDVDGVSVLADGLAVQLNHRLNMAMPSGAFVANLRQDRRPRLTIDRKKVLEYDDGWIRRTAEDEWASLVGWNALNLDWLWDLAQAWPGTAERLVNALVASGARVPLKYGEQVKFRLDVIGCFPIDRNILDAIRSMPDDLEPLGPEHQLEKRSETLRQLRGLPRKLLAHRAELWQRAYCIPLGIPHEWIDAPPFDGGALFPIDNLLFSANLDGQRPLTRELNPARAVLAAFRLGMRLAGVLRRAQRLAPLGLRSPAVNPTALDEIEVDATDARILSRHLDGQIPLVGKRIEPTHMLSAALRLGLRPAEILRRLARFTSLGLQIPQVDPADVEDLMVEETDLRLLSSEARTAWLMSETVDIPALLERAAALELPPATAFRRLARLAPLGIKLPRFDPGVLEAIELDATDKKLLSLVLERSQSDQTDAVSPQSLLNAALQLDARPADILRRLHRLAPLGVESPAIDPSSIEVLDNDDINIRLISVNLDGESPYFDTAVPAHHLARAAARLKIHPVEVLRRLRQLAPIGIQPPEISTAEVDGLVFDAVDFDILTRVFDAFSERTEVPTRVPAGAIVAIAVLVDLRPSEVLSRLSRFGWLGVVLPPVIPSGIDTIEVDKLDNRILSRSFDGSPPYLDGAVPLGHIVAAASELRLSIADLLHRLSRLAPIGISSPPIDILAVEDFYVEPGDAAILSLYLDGEAPWLDSDVPAMHVFNAAATLQRPPSDVLAQIHRLAPLGVKAPTIAKQAHDLRFDKKDIEIFRRFIWKQTLSTELSVDLDLLQDLASVADLPLTETARRIVRLGPSEGVQCGFDLPMLTSVGFDEMDLRLLSLYFDGRDPFLGRRAGAEHIARAIRALHLPREEVIRRLRRLEPLGIQLVEDDG